MRDGGACLFSPWFRCWCACPKDLYIFDLREFWIFVEDFRCFLCDFGWCTSTRSIRVEIIKQLEKAPTTGR